MTRWTALLAASLVLFAIPTTPAETAGPCDNDVERLVCDAFEPVRQLLWWLCQHGTQPACKAGDVLP